MIPLLQKNAPGLRGLFVAKRIVTKKSATAKTQMNIGGYTGEKRSPSIDLFSQMILHVVQVVNLNSGTGPDHAKRQGGTAG